MPFWRHNYISLLKPVKTGVIDSTTQETSKTAQIKGTPTKENKSTRENFNLWCSEKNTYPTSTVFFSNFIFKIKQSLKDRYFYICTCKISHV